MSNRRFNEPASPTQKEIAKRCAEIQTAWSPAERRKRSIGAVAQPWRPPSVRVSLDRAAVEAATE